MKRVLVVLVVVTALAALLAFGMQPRDPRAVASPHIGKTLNDWEAPVFERYQAQYGETLRYSDYAGKGTPLVINFWASWCVACAAEAPRLEAAWRKHQAQVLFLGVDFQDKDEDARDMMDRFDKTYPSVKDPKGRVGIEWGVFGVPETFFIRADGTLSYKHIGEISTETLETQIRALLE